MQAQDIQPALPLRSHTILGVCEGLGEDFGFNPIWIRLPLAAGVLASPQIAIGAYLVLGLIVLASRLLFPKAKPASAETVVQADAPVKAANSDVEAQLTLAA